MIPFLLGAICLVSVARAELAVIVNAQNPMSSITRTELSDIYLKKVKTFPGGISIRVFDRPDESEIKNEFLKTVLKRSSRDVELYWIGQKLYSGHAAPTQVSTDSMMEIMVSRFPGGIGYIAPDYEITRSVKKIKITE